MSDSPRWPGSEGSPGLDFSPYRKAATAEAEKVAKEASVPEDPTSTMITPSAQERAAQTAKAWAATPNVAADPAAATPAKEEDKAGEPAKDEKTSVLSKIHGEDTGVQPVVADAVASSRPARRTRKARLRLSRLDPWSVMKTTFLFAIAFGVMLVVATFVLWSVLAGSGALESVNTLLNTLIGDSDTQFKIEDYLSVSRVLGFSVLIAAIDVVIITAVATLLAFLYNLAAVVMGGLELTLAED